MAKTLEEILQTYFGCKVAFRKDGEFTTTGIEAYKRLEDLLNDLEGLKVIRSASQAARVLDEICDENCTAKNPKHQDKTPKVLREAIKYVADKIDDCELDYIKAEANRCWNQHLVPTETLIDCEGVVELLEEYGEDNGLPERWWEEYCEIHEIIGRL